MNKEQLVRHLREQRFSDSTINAIGNVPREDFVNPDSGLSIFGNARFGFFN